MQIKSKGTLQAQEMRQLGEAGVAAWKMLADYLNITVQEAMDRVQKRAVDSQTATTAILTGMQKQFAGQMEAQAGTFNGRMTVMVSTFKQAMVQAVVPVFTMLRDQLFPQVTEKLRVFASVAQSGTLSLAFDAFTRSVKGLNEALTVSKILLEAYIARMTFMAITTIGTVAVKAVTTLRTAITGLTAAQIALNTTFAGTAVATFSSAAASGAGMVGKLSGAVNVLNTAVLALGKNLYWVIPLLAKLASDKIFGYDWNKSVSSLSERQGDGTKPANMSPIGGVSYGDPLSQEQAARRETSRQEYLNQDRLFMEQAKANQQNLDNLLANPVGGTSGGSGSDKYSKFVQGIKAQAKELKLSYEQCALSVEEYTAALDKLAATPGLKEVNRLDIIKQKWQAMEPIWKQYSESIDKAEDDRLASYEKGKKFITQWNATEIEMARMQAASKLEIQREYDQAEYESFGITKDELIARQMDYEAQMYALSVKALQDRLALGGLEVSERDSIHQQLLQLELDYNLKKVQLDNQLQQNKKTVASSLAAEFDRTQTGLTDSLVALPATLADVFAQAAVGYASLSDMLKDLARQLAFAAIKAMLLKMIMGMVPGGGGAVSGVAGIFGISNHTGGIVGSEGSKRFISMFPKFHSGGLSGDEQVAVLQKGEGVFTKKQMEALGNDHTIINMTIKAIDAKGVRDFFVSNRGYVEGMVAQSVKRSGPVRTAIKGA